MRGHQEEQDCTCAYCELARKMDDVLMTEADHDVKADVLGEAVAVVTEGCDRPVEALVSFFIALERTWHNLGFESDEVINEAFAHMRAMVRNEPGANAPTGRTIH